MPRSKLLILDEPTRRHDVRGKADIQTLIRELADRDRRLMNLSECEEVIEGSDRSSCSATGERRRPCRAAR